MAWPDLILSSSATGLWRQGRHSLYAGCLTSVPWHNVWPTAWRRKWLVTASHWLSSGRCGWYVHAHVPVTNLILEVDVIDFWRSHSLTFPFPSLNFIPILILFPWGCSYSLPFPHTILEWLTCSLLIWYYFLIYCVGLLLHFVIIFTFIVV